MLRGAGGGQQRQVSRSSHLLVFSVGGKRLAVRTTEVGGISAWIGSVPIPSRTPYVAAVVRQEHGIVPVFDLAGLLKVRVRGAQRLCLMAKHPGGAMAICIDEEMPSLHVHDLSMICPYEGAAFPTSGRIEIDLEEIPIISFAKLGHA